ncbi:MAG: amidohydrolase family protein [Lysobacter sp.]|nr:amidohydrolase family protein [Lysobacter sp.]
MKPCTRRSGTGVAVAIAIAASLSSASQAATPARDNDADNDFVIRNVRVFDGTRVLPNTSVLVIDGRIAAVGAKFDAPKDFPTIDGSGKTLLPGLIDAHTHSWGDAPRDALRFGVTAELDMMGDPGRLPALKTKRESLARSDEADLWSAGAAVTAPGGHGTQYGMKVPTLAADGDAAAFVAARVGEGSDYIKLIIEDMSAYSATMRIPTIAEAQVKSAIAAAHKARKLAVVHVSRLSEGRSAIAGGADGLVHIFGEPGDAAFLDSAKKSKAFVIPTLSVLATMAQTGEGRALGEDARLKPWLAAAQADSLKATFGAAAPKPGILANAIANVRALHAAGVDILAGTDAGNPGTAHGASMHGELELLVRAGLTPSEALAAATSVPARRFNLGDRGRIAAGQRADLWMVDGDPTRDILATRAIVHVWKNGYAVARVQPQAPTAPIGEAIPAGSLVDDFEGDVATSPMGMLPAKFGAGWMQTTDQLAGGASIATLKRDKGALAVSGEIKTGFAFPWSGAMYFPASAPMQPADLSARKELVFRARGDGRDYSVMLFSGVQMQSMPSMKPFVAGSEWTEVRIPLDSFNGADLGRVRGFAFTAGQPVGAFAFQIDDVELK